MGQLTEQELAEITRREVAAYEGTSPHATIYAILDDSRQHYAITGIENEPGPDQSWIILQARVVDRYVIIDVDSLMDKNLWKALEAAGVPREQIALAYLGEHIPESSEA